ncbi:MAG: hypothetical protein A2365_02135 [Candidatus Nealsonbacteria bacterium RIFOXYB1_FULL_40_15]|uniref:Phosphatidic acid phosphatase type 2/haloperoxidase domain-containing protein n=2 Tax=Candidatus Nealsoniibacteriota TaxID=1817911 RepID=A0A1G2ESF4_9BACT|nr:MAG: hypothetical protein A2365_02135 [Candidatus Nealsonbacteria bacterium RIFOXYB1_FULL_40_15]OGZ28657.1 MAG: hypothetical protein A2427_04580 [Candidatus Nealsonbacteria bacterium RIFOXYC1_FULL_40_7]OGZ28873.1 MAG: hypothetical protein A2562_00740 [Candidatus Nealsonbacteria bacterium RIFOXYD1_FULL_39_11]
MNEQLFNLINSYALRWYWLDVLAVFFASYFEYAVIASLLIFLAVNYSKYLRVVALSVFSAVFARAFIEIIYFAYKTTRPFAVREVSQLVSHSLYNSFPSGHSTFFFALAAIIFLYNKKAGILYFLFAFLISLARVFSGIHWPVDILGGASIGIFLALALNSAYKRISKII